MREAHVPAKQPEAQQDSRLPDPDADAGWPIGHQGAPRPGSQAPLGLIWRVRDRATFEALGRARPIRRGPVWLKSALYAVDSPPCAAFSVGRGVGNAVVRNRLRRRLRAAVRLARPSLVPGRAYLFGVGREAVTMPFETLVAAVESLALAAAGTR